MRAGRRRAAALPAALSAPCPKSGKGGAPNAGSSGPAPAVTLWPAGADTAAAAADMPAISHHRETIVRAFPAPWAEPQQTRSPGAVF